MNDKALKYKYLGPLYAGEEMAYFQVTYDTMCAFTARDNKYDITQSNTSKAWLDKDGNPVTQRVDLGSVIFNGPLYNETMCLYHNFEI